MFGNFTYDLPVQTEDPDPAGVALLRAIFQADDRPDPDYAGAARAMRAMAGRSERFRTMRRLAAEDAHARRDGVVWSTETRPVVTRIEGGYRITPGPAKR